MSTSTQTNGKTIPLTVSYSTISLKHPVLLTDYDGNVDEMGHFPCLPAPFGSEVKLMSENHVDGWERYTVYHITEGRVFSNTRTTQDGKVMQDEGSLECHHFLVKGAKKKNLYKEVERKEHKTRYIGFQYDIPDTCPLANPSGRLWRAGGFRWTLSVWVIKQAFLPASLLREFHDYNATRPCNTKPIKFFTMRFDLCEEQTILALAREKIDEEVVRIGNSLLKSINAADERLKEALAAAGDVAGEKTVTKLKKNADNNKYAALRLASEALDQAIECAAKFDLTQDLNDHLTGLKHIIESNRALYLANKTK